MRPVSRAHASSAVTIYGPIHQPYWNHNGGCIQFGPDGMLYFGLGDGGSGGDPGDRSQNKNNEMGKLMRFDIDIPHPHIPPSNPYVGLANHKEEIWSIGWRNPWRFSGQTEL